MQTLESKKIEDYLHFYLGCECYQRDEEGGEVTIGKLIEIGVHKAVLAGTLCDYEFVSWEVKPMLRSLMDMTDAEKSEIKVFYHDEMGQADRTRYLLSKHFDLFGLIPAGLAIDKTQKQ